MAKELYFNHGGSATKKLLAGVDLVTELVGVTLGPRGRNVVLQNKYGPPKIVNDGETILKEIEREDPLENVGVKLVRQGGAKTNDISEGVKVIAAGMNPIQISRAIEKTAKALVSELKQMSREVEDHELVDVATVSAGNNYAVGNMISDALQQVGRKGVVTIEKGNHAENALQIVEGMQFDRGYLSPYFVTDRQKMIVEFHDCKTTHHHFTTSSLTVDLPLSFTIDLPLSHTAIAIATATTTATAIARLLAPRISSLQH